MQPLRPEEAGLEGQQDRSLLSGPAPGLLSKSLRFLICSGDMPSLCTPWACEKLNGNKHGKTLRVSCKSHWLYSSKPTHGYPGDENAGKQAEREHECPRARRVTRGGRDTEEVSREREAPTALRNDGNSERGVRGSLSTERSPPISKDTELRHRLGPTHTSLVIYSRNDTQYHFPSTMTSPPKVS